MKDTKWRIIVLSFVVLSFLFVSGCTFDTTTFTSTTEQAEITTNEQTTTLQETQTTTLQETQTTTDEQTQTTTTEEQTTTTSAVTTTEEQTTTTELVEEEYESLDELLLSLNRLENADFSVNTEFVEEAVQQTPLDAPSNGFRKYAWVSTTSIIDSHLADIIDPSDYTQDQFSSYIYYNNAILSTPDLVDGMYRITTSLDGRTLFNLNGFVTDLGNVADMSKSTVDWAVENLKVMNTWVTKGSYSVYSDNMYLLEYDSETDTVTLYNYYRRTDDMKIDLYTKISVYYNENGEEVIETWQIFEYYEGPDDSGVSQYFSYYNSINGRDYNIATFSIDEYEEYMDDYMLRGVNLDTDGRYKFYESYNWGDRSYIKGDNGWFMYSPEFNAETKEITPEDDISHYIFSPDLGNEAIAISKESENYLIYVMLSAFDGDIAVVYEEDCVGAGIIYNTQEYYTYSSSLTAAGGFETSNGTFLTTDSLWNDTVGIRSIYSRADKESRIMYDQYFNYYHVLKLEITATTDEEAIDELAGYLDYVGLTFRFGTNSDLLAEYNEFATNIEENISTFPITNAVMGYDQNPYTDTDVYSLTLDFLVDYLNIIDTAKALMETSEIIDISEQPDFSELTNVVLYDMSEILDGVAIVDIQNQTIDVSAIDIILNRSPLLQRGEEYCIYYAYMIGGKVYPFYQSDGVIYSGTEIVFDNTNPALINLPNDLPDGQYQIVVFIGKVNYESYVRVTTTIPIEVTEFAESDINLENVNGFNYTYAFTNVNNSIQVTKVSYDIWAPQFNYIYDQIIEAGTADIDWCDLIIEPFDNAEGLLTMVEEEDNVIYDTPGVYTVTISVTDESLNTRTQTFKVTVIESS